MEQDKREQKDLEPLLWSEANLDYFLENQDETNKIKLISCVWVAELFKILRDIFPKKK